MWVHSQVQEVFVWICFLLLPCAPYCEGKLYPVSNGVTFAPIFSTVWSNPSWTKFCFIGVTAPHFRLVCFSSLFHHYFLEWRSLQAVIPTLGNFVVSDKHNLHSLQSPSGYADTVINTTRYVDWKTNPCRFGFHKPLDIEKRSCCCVINYRYTTFIFCLISFYWRIVCIMHNVQYREDLNKLTSEPRINRTVS